MLNKSLLLIIIIVTFIVLVAAYIYKLISRKNEKVEKYTPVPENMTLDKINPVVNEFIRENGFDDVDSLRKFVHGDYDENLEDIMENNALTLYYSIFSKSSLSEIEDNELWKNISPHFKNNANINYKTLNYDNSHIQFSETPSINSSYGIGINSNKATGPPSHILGMKGNSNFSLFTVIKFDKLPDPSTNFHNLIKLYGNTLNNNGLDLSLQSLPHKSDAKVVDVKFSLKFGDEDAMLIKNDVSETFPLDLDKKYMIVITKRQQELIMNIHDMNVDFTHETVIPLIHGEIKDTNMLFSNRRFQINEASTLHGTIYAFGIYKKSIQDESHLHRYIYKQLIKKQDRFIKESEIIIKFQEEIDLMRSCKYDKQVCKECIEIDDWTNINQIINASPKCKSSIDTYCQNNLNDPKCACWRDEKINDIECRSYVNIFKREPLHNVETLNGDILEDVKKKYNLVDNEDLQKWKEKYSTLEAELTKQKENAKMTESHRLSSSLIPGGEVEYNKNKNGFEQRNTLLKNVHGSESLSKLPPVNEESMEDILNKYKHYSGRPEDAEKVNTPIDQAYGDPGVTINNPRYDEGEGGEGGEEEMKTKGFWSWLFRM